MRGWSENNDWNFKEKEWKQKHEYSRKQKENENC